MTWPWRQAYAKNLLGDSLAHSQHHLPWSQKMPRIFWRGSLSAPDNFAVDDIASLPRVRLLTWHRSTQTSLMSVSQMSNLGWKFRIKGPIEDFSSSNARDSKSTSRTILFWWPFDDRVLPYFLKGSPLSFSLSEDREIYKVAGVSNIESLLQRLGGKVKRKNFAREMPKYRYLINVAAVLSSWRLVDMLATKSVLLLQESWDHELIMEWLVPWEHYVPISPGLSDLIEKVQWLERNQDIAESIAERGFQRFSERVRRQDTLCYIWQAFQTLADVQTQATPEELQDRVSEMKEVKPKLAKLEKYGSASAISPVKDVKATELWQPGATFSFVIFVPIRHSQKWVPWRKEKKGNDLPWPQPLAFVKIEHLCTNLPQTSQTLPTGDVFKSKEHSKGHIF